MSKDEEKELNALFLAVAYIASLPKGMADELNKLLGKCTEWKPSFEIPDLCLPDKTGDYLVYAKYTDENGVDDGEGWEVAAFSKTYNKFLMAEPGRVEILLWSALPDYRG